MDKYQDLINEARIACQNKNLDEAIRLYEEAFQEKIMIEDLIDLGLVYIDNKNPLKSQNVFQTVIDFFPKSPYGYYGMGLVLEDLGKYDEAIGYYNKAIEQDISFAEAYFNIALIAEDRNDTAKTYDYYKKTLLYNPNHFWANLNLGAFYEKNDYLDLAVKHTLKAYEINPNEKMVAYNLGVYYAKQHKYQDAIRFYLEEIEKANGYMMAYLNLGLIYKDIYQDYAKTKYYYLSGIEKDKDNTTLWYNLGCLYCIMNDYENGINCLLYAGVKDPKLKLFMEEDEELSEFRKTDEYKNLLKKF